MLFSVHCTNVNSYEYIIYIYKLKYTVKYTTNNFKKLNTRIPTHALEHFVILYYQQNSYLFLKTKVSA